MSNLHDGDHVHHGHQDDHHHLEAGEGRRAADLVGGTRMGTSCHLAYLLHIFTIAGIIIININIVTITIVTIVTITICSIVNVSLTFSVLRFSPSVLL